jgi:hypothetical protein
MTAMEAQFLSLGKPSSQLEHLLVDAAAQVRQSKVMFDSAVWNC